MFCYFVSDLHGKIDRYRKLFQQILREEPRIVLLGGDLLPFGGRYTDEDGDGSGNFVLDYLAPQLAALRDKLREAFPHILLILGNDDPRRFEASLLVLERENLLKYMHNRWISIDTHRFCGYSCVPPTPFLLKDWERYDVSRFVDPGCISPEEGIRTIPAQARDTKFRTIVQDIDRLVSNRSVAESIFLFHTPPYKTKLDRAALDGKAVDHVPVDVHIGSIAVRNFIEKRQPLLTLHGHVHESARITGSWMDRIGRTFCFSAAHDGSELALVKFDLAGLEGARRELA